MARVPLYIKVQNEDRCLCSKSCPFFSEDYLNASCCLFNVRLSAGIPKPEYSLQSEASLDYCRCSGCMGIYDFDTRK